MMRKVVSICFLIISFSACNYKGSEKLEKLEKKITTANVTFEALDPSLVTNAANGYNSNLELVKKCVDSAENEFSQAMNNYKGMKKSTPDFFNSYSITKENLSNEISQLEMLATDLQNNFIPEDSIPLYLNLEDKNIDMIFSDLHELTLLYNFIIETNDSLYTYVKTFAEKYCEKNEK
jgi:archaellum component FlaC